MPRKLLLAHLCLAVLFTGTSLAAQPEYKLDVVASGNTPISGITLGTIFTSVVNDNDTVVFTAYYNDGSYAGARGVFTPKRVLLKKGDTVRGLTVGLVSLCGLNDFDELALTFSYGPNGGSAIGKFVWKGDRLVPEGKLVKRGDTIDGHTIQLFRECAINDMGEVAFSADYTDSSGNSGTGVFTRDRVILKTGSVVGGIPISGSNYFGHLDGLSDLGTIVFDTYGTLPNLGAAQAGAFTQHRVLAITGETIDGIPLLFASSPSISHFDREAFTGTYSIDPSCSQSSYSCQGTAVFTRKAVVAKTGDTISGVTLSSVSVTGINDEGTVLLWGNFAGGYGLFTKDSVIVLTTDTIDGNIVGGLGSSAINDRGTVLFNTDRAVVLARRNHKH